MNGYAEAFFPPAPSYPIVDRLTDGPAVVDLRQMAPLRLFAAQTHQQAPRCPRSVNGVRTFALPLASAPCSLISRPPAASSSSSVPHGSRLNFAVPALGSGHAITLSLPRVHGSTFRLPLDLLPSTPPLASDSSQPPKSVTALAQRTHPSHSCCRSVLSLFPTPSASSPM